MGAVRKPSSVIEGVAYDAERATLSIWFRETGRYLYHLVPRAVYEGLNAAESRGRYFNSFIKNRYPCTPDPARRRFRPPSNA